MKVDRVYNFKGHSTKYYINKQFELEVSHIFLGSFYNVIKLRYLYVYSYIKFKFLTVKVKVKLKIHVDTISKLKKVMF